MLHPSKIEFTITPLPDFEEIRGEWDRLNEENGKLPILHSDFVEPLIKYFSKSSLWLMRATHDDETTLLVLLEKAGFGRWKTFQPSQSPVCLAVVSSPDRGSELLLNKPLPSNSLMIDFTQIDPEIIARPVINRRDILLMNYVSIPRISVSGDFDEFFSLRSRNTRHNIRKQLRKLEADGISPRLEVIRSPSDMESVIVDFGRLEESGWKGKAGTAVAPNNRQGHFYLDIMKRFAEKGAATAYRFWYGDDLAGCDLCIGMGSTIVILKTAYNEDFAKFSPGLLMHYKIFEDIYSSGYFKSIEFYGKTMDWHRKWTSDERVMYHAGVYRWPLVGWLQRVYSHAKHWRRQKAA